MKVLLLTTEYAATTYSEFNSGLHKQIGSMDIRRLAESDKRNLRYYFSLHVDLTKFDRIIFQLDFSVIKNQLRFLKTLEKIIFITWGLEFNQNSSFSNKSEHIRFLKRIPWAKVLVSSFSAMKTFQTEGLDAWYIPESYNTIRPQNEYEKNNKNIELAFIVNEHDDLQNDVREFQNKLMQHFPDVYVEKVDQLASLSHLSDVKIAVCADIDRGEYSGKVFRAMLSGCLVMSYNQGVEETKSNSLEHMKNIILFDNFQQFLESTNDILLNPQLLNDIAESGKNMAEHKYLPASIGRLAGCHIAASVRKSKDFDLGISAFGLKF